MNVRMHLRYNVHETCTADAQPAPPAISSVSIIVSFLV